MSDVKQVKVDNWGIYFLQRLKHFFNRTDYCDLTLQFQDNAQLKVHRLVLSACTEYFELLERTCEMYEDCLVMPDDLQADVVVPIVNFMYTGQLEFKMELLDKLHQTSEIMSMPVLTKLLDSHRPKINPKVVPQSYNHNTATRTSKRVDSVKEVVKTIPPTEIVTTTSVKRSYSKAFDTQTTVYRDKKIYLPLNKPAATNGPRTYRAPSPIPLDHRYNKKVVSGDPRPTRYELPEELDEDNLVDNSFCNISYTSQPLMVHPETRKQYIKRPKASNEASTSKKFGVTMLELVNKKSREPEDTLFEDSMTGDDSEVFTQSYVSSKAKSPRDPNHLFDQILEGNDESSKVSIETKNTTKSSSNLDHAKIISEVLKKYPHLVKSNKNIKLKILNTPNKNTKKIKNVQSLEKQGAKNEKCSDFTYETDVIDSKQAAKLIAMGAENIEGPWICLICGTPGKAMNFTSYYKFRRHLVDVHNEKPVINICEYCGQKATKRNFLFHHLFTKHGVKPPPSYNFPKCNHCNYVALTEALLIKHKASHTGGNKSFRCNVCPAAFHSSHQLLLHIQNTGHKYSSDIKSNLRCIYCQNVFMRESNLCAHLKINHREEAIRDGIIDDSDEELPEPKLKVQNISIKSEPSPGDYEELDIQYQIQQRPDGNIHVVTSKTPKMIEPVTSAKQKILNSGFTSQVHLQKNKTIKTITPQTEYIQEINMTDTSENPEEIVVIDNSEYIMRDNQLIPRRPKQVTEEFIMTEQDTLQPVMPSTSMDYTNIHNSNAQDNIQQTNVLLKNPGNLNPIPIYVSNEEEYKALMATNQPIIFDGNDSNKTLTVLTAPHTSTLETTSIDLDNTQSNDMMLIPEQFPLNVSEAVPSENSNIVVVYSHQVGDQNKQFQLLTTQGLEAQFVQSSAILTQNYETVTTTAPIMNAHVLEKQDVWQSNLHQIVNNEQLEITPVTELPAIIQSNETQINTAKSNTHIDELPHIRLTSSVTEVDNINVSSDTVATPSICQSVIAQEVAVIENLNENTEDITEEVPSLGGDEEVPIEHSVEETVESVKATVTPEHEPLRTQTVIQENETVIQHTEHIDPEQEPISDEATENFEPVLQQTEEIEVDGQTADMESIPLNNIEEQVQEEQVEDPNIISDASIVEQQLESEDSQDKGALTSEWTEENTEINDNETLVQNNRITANVVTQTSMETSEELEESIENIQQEVEKQMSEGVPATVANGEEVDTTSLAPEEVEEPLQDNNVPEVTETTGSAIAHEKISSLLNDWEDNDSQDNSVNETQEEEPVASKELNEAPTETIVDSKTDKVDDKDSNIKSLVSDWDEEEEEENKE